MLDLATLTLRVFMGIIMIPHGVHKVERLDSLNDKWRKKYGMPTGSVLLAAVLQIVGGLALVFGVYSRYAAIILALVMVVATFTSIAKEHEPFLSTPAGKGWDFNLFLLGALVVLVVLGDGNWSLMGLLP